MCKNLVIKRGKQGWVALGKRREKTVLNTGFPGKRKKDKRKRKRRFMDCVKQDMMAIKLTEEDTKDR